MSLQTPQYKMTSQESFNTCRELPMASLQQEFLSAYNKSQVLVVSGEIDSDHINKVLNFVLFDQHEPAIACTQSLRINAISAAGDTSRLVYMTDVRLLELAKSDVLFQKYGCIVIDEAHERRLATDVLLALLKSAVTSRLDLKVIVTSDTANASKFLAYFERGVHFAIPSDSFQVDIRWLLDPDPNFLELAVHTAKHIHETTGDGDILMFLTGTGEIKSACAQLKNTTKDLDVLTFPQRDNIIKQSSRRRCIITGSSRKWFTPINGIVYVIDSGLAIDTRFNPRAGLEIQSVAPISQAEARYRARQAGRSGVCYRLCTKSDFDEVLLPTVLPPILVSDLSELVLQLKAMGINDVANFDFVDKPHPEVFLPCFEDLHAMGYLTDVGVITERGQKAARLPVHPLWYNALERAHELGCSDELITIAATKSIRNYILTRPPATRQAADLAHQQFACPMSDHITELNAFHAYLDTEASSDHSDALQSWCSTAFLSMQALEDVKRIRIKLVESFAELFGAPSKRANFESRDYDLGIRKALACYFQTVTAIEPEWLIGSNNFREESWQVKQTKSGNVYRMSLAKASFDKACNAHNAED
ncbi:hypothetical protein NXS19_005688 [Fusarium pseudograminearum]|nr:hypothetical protein NXS19_005688 [Fusarium pseudograminearum]